MSNWGAEFRGEPLWTVDGDETFTELYKRTQVGDCVNSVAHDLNNYLGAMLSYSELVGMEEGLSPDAKRMIGEVGAAIQKSTRLLSTLTAIARKERPCAVISDIPELVDRVVAMRKYEFGVKRIKIETKAAENLGTYLVDEPKLIRALLALLMNAVENVSDQSSCRIEIAVEGTDEGVGIRVSDSGPPISEDDRAFIFEPFFTTKNSGHLGLGLTQALEAARHHNGDLTYDPERGFTLTIPRNTGLG